MTEELFPLGAIVATPAALKACGITGEAPTTFIRRHVTGDWGDLDPHDQAANQRGVNGGNRIFSSYRLKDATKIWVITESDRSVTTVLLPEDY